MREGTGTSGDVACRHQRKWSQNFWPVCPLLFPFVCYADQGKELKVIKSRLKEILFLAITAYEETNPLKQTKL